MAVKVHLEPAEFQGVIQEHCTDCCRETRYWLDPHTPLCPGCAEKRPDPPRITTALIKEQHDLMIECLAVVGRSQPKLDHLLRGIAEASGCGDQYDRSKAGVMASSNYNYTNGLEKIIQLLIDLLPQHKLDCKSANPTEPFDNCDCSYPKMRAALASLIGTNRHRN